MELLEIQMTQIIYWYSILKKLLGNIKLNKKILCESCKGKKISHYDDYYIRWIPFNEFKNIGYLAKGDFGEVHKATWIRYGYYYKQYKQEVVLKRIYNNSSDDKIVDIL